MEFRTKGARLLSLTLASALLGILAALTPALLPVAVIGPVALWWRYGYWGRSTAVLAGWLPAWWAGLAVAAVHGHVLLGVYLLTGLLGSLAGLVVAASIAKRLPSLPGPGSRAMRKVADAGPHALTKGGTCHVLARGDKGRGLIFSRPDTHTLALGPTRTGKTTSLISPNALAWTAGSLVVTSTKHDVLDTAGAMRATLGAVYVLDVLGTLPDSWWQGRPEWVHRVRWTPLRGCADWNTARDRAAAMTGAIRKAGTVTDADHWSTQGERVLAPLLHAAARCKLTLREVVLWTASAATLQEPLGLLDELGDAKEAHAQLRGVLSQDARPRDSILATVTTALHPYAGRILDEAAAATEGDWHPEAFLSGTNSLFVIAPVDGEADQPAPIVVGLLSELYSATRRLSDKGGGRLPNPSLWVLDEVANISPLPKLPQWLAESAGRGLTFLLGAQDYAQLAERWGKEGATAMWSNLTTKVVFPGISNPDTLRQLEQLAGKRWESQTSYSHRASRWRTGKPQRRIASAQVSQVQLPRYTQDALYGLPEDQCLVFRPDWPHPYLQPQSRAYRTEPFATWARMPWPAGEPTLTLAGTPIASNVPTPSP